NENAQELKSDSFDNDKDLLFLSSVLKNKTLVGLGEASHGTQEFFFQKCRIIKYLVSKENYKLIAIEVPTNYINPINDYILTGKGDIKDKVKSMGLFNSEELLKLYEWLKIFNESRPEH